MIATILLAVATSMPTVAPVRAVCTVPRLHALAMSGVGVVDDLRHHLGEKSEAYAKLDALVRTTDECARASLTRLGSSLSETDSTLAFEAISRRIRVRLIRAEAEVYYHDFALARIDLRDAEHDVASMREYTRDYEPGALAEREGMYRRYDGDVRFLTARIRHEERMAERLTAAHS